MEIEKLIRFIPQQRQWPGRCAPPRSWPGAYPEGPAAAGHSSPITPASLAGGASPSPEVYAAPGNALKSMRMQLVVADVDSEPARMAAMAQRPTAVAGTCTCVRRWTRATGPHAPVRIWGRRCHAQR